MPVPACLQHPLSSRLCGRLPQPQPFFSPVKCQRHLTTSPRPQKRSRCRASTEAQTDEQPEVQIEGIDQNFCDDFVCTSSPAVERNLRALARDVVRTSTWTADLFADEVRYKVSVGCWYHTVCKLLVYLVSAQRCLKPAGQVQVHRGHCSIHEADLPCWSSERSQSGTISSPACFWTSWLHLYICKM